MAEAKHPTRLSRVAKYKLFIMPSQGKGTCPQGLEGSSPITAPLNKWFLFPLRVPGAGKYDCLHPPQCYNTLQRKRALLQPALLPRHPLEAILLPFWHLLPLNPFPSIWLGFLSTLVPFLSSGNSPPIPHSVFIAPVSHLALQLSSTLLFCYLLYVAIPCLKAPGPTESHLSPIQACSLPPYLLSFLKLSCCSSYHDCSFFPLDHPVESCS